MPTLLISSVKIGKRFMRYFPNLFNLGYSPARFSLRSTQVSRTGRSANAFSYSIVRITDLIDCDISSNWISHSLKERETLAKAVTIPFSSQRPT